MAINDTVEMTDSWTPEQVAAVDLGMQEQGLPTLTEVRARFSKLVRRAVRRGSIKGEVEYYAVQNAAQLLEGERLLPLLTDYERRPRR